MQQEYKNKAKLLIEICINMYYLFHLYQIINKKIISKKISQGALKKMAGQLRFLSEKLVGLALFDNELNNETKNEMVLAIKEKGIGDS